jgi:restriction endonuclease S subunit
MAAVAKNKLDRVIEDANELETFLHALLPALDEQKLRQGDDVLGYAKKLKLKIPESLRGAEVTWETNHSGSPLKRGGESLSFVRPGHANAVGLVIKCVRVGKWKFCLECGWLWCRIVVTRRF